MTLHIILFRCLSLCHRSGIAGVHFLRGRIHNITNLPEKRSAGTEQILKLMFSSELEIVQVIDFENCWASFLVMITFLL